MRCDRISDERCGALGGIGMEDKAGAIFLDRTGVVVLAYLCRSCVFTTARVAIVVVDAG